MPIYEFLCEKCGLKFEKIQCKSDKVPCCERCGAQARRLVSICGFTSAGGGKSSAKIGGSCSGCSSHNCGSCSH